MKYESINDIFDECLSLCKKYEIDMLTEIIDIDDNGIDEIKVSINNATFDNGIVFKHGKNITKKIEHISIILQDNGDKESMINNIKTVLLMLNGMGLLNITRLEK